MLFKRVGDDMQMTPVGVLRGTATLPGSKSLTNRYLICAALADGLSTLRGVTLADDVLAMIGGLRSLGILVDVRGDEGVLEVHGCRGQIRADNPVIDVGNAGTAMRFLTALACLGHGRVRLDGSARMRQRPIGELVGALQSIGGGLGYDEVPGYPPITMHAKGLAGGTVAFDRPVSSQFVSALLMAAPYAARDVFIEIAGGLVSRPYVEMTIAVMQSRGVDALGADGARYVIAATQRYQPKTIEIEPDASGATYLWAGAAITGGAVTVHGLTRKALQGDVCFVNVLAAMGCRIEETDESLTIVGPQDGKLRGVDVDLNGMPDTVQTLAVTALFAEGPTVIRNVANLRVKETDRLTALQTELTRLGATVELRDDGLMITPPEKLTPAAIETYDDHRMAMSFALAGLMAEGIVIRDAECVRKSFPDYFEMLASLATDGA